MVEFLFLDMDDTILDFQKAEQVAIQKTLAEAGIQPTEAVCKRYSQINDGYWKKLERGEVTQAQLRVMRFADLIEELGVEADALGCAESYMENLGIGHYFMDGAEEAVKSLSQKYKLYLASNGQAKTQQSRLDSAGIEKYFDGVFISGKIGVNKPSPQYFAHCFDRIPGFDLKKAMIVGDSLTSDILGGKNAGITTCWVNPTHKIAPAELKPDYEIEGIAQLERLLETLC